MDLVQDLEQIDLQSETKLLQNLNHNSNKSQITISLDFYWSSYKKQIHILRVYY